jgi:Na+/H+-dicarboxylate symporter
MFRTMTNVVGNALATSVVSKWEGELKPEGAPAGAVFVNDRDVAGIDN